MSARMLWLNVPLIILLIDTAAWAGPGCCGGGGRSSGAVAPSGPRAASYVTTEQPAPPQQMCPVCGGQLSQHGAPVTVAYTVAVTEPKTFWQKMGLQAARPPRQVQLPYKVCGQQCAAQAEQDAATYYVKTFAERGAKR